MARSVKTRQAVYAQYSAIAKQYGVTASLFKEWRSPRFGETNPTPMNNCVWEWLYRTKHDAYTATAIFGGPSRFEAGPGWCFERFGQTCTMLADGRSIHIAGEHEDHYHPDFYIYNDVVVESADGGVEFYSYPRDVFPPTDFHSATLVGQDIIIIGNLGYPDDRMPGTTQVLALDIASLKVRPLETFGDMPGWLHRHQATLSEDYKTILITGGKIDRGSGHYSLENLDDWRLDLETRIWSCVMHRHWPRWEIYRSDKGFNCLQEIRQALWDLESGWEKEYATDIMRLEETLGIIPDLPAVNKIYRPELPHDVLPERESEYGIYRIQIADTTVRYVEERHCIRVTIEGDLSEQIASQLIEDLRRKLSKLENTEYLATEIV